MRHFTILACALVLVVGATLVGQAETWSQPADQKAIVLVRALDQALNAHDAETAVNLLAPDATVQDDRRPQTRQQIQGWMQELIRQQVRVELIDSPRITQERPLPEATTVTWQATLDLQMYRALGLRLVPATLEARVVDDAIVFLRIRPDPRWNPLLDSTSLT